MTSLLVMSGSAVILVVFIASSLRLSGGADTIQAPLVWTIAIAATASAVVGSLTTQWSRQDGPGATAEIRGNAAFVFTNSVGGFITLLAATAETIDGEFNPRSGIGIVVQAFVGPDATTILLWFGLVGWFLVACSLVVLICGLRMYSRVDAASPSELSLLNTCSVFFLVVGLIAGTTWRDIPFGAREVADVSRMAMVVTLLIVAVALLSVLFTRAVGSLFALIAQGASLARSDQARALAGQILDGILWLLLFFMAAKWTINWLQGLVASIPAVDSFSISRILTTNRAQVDDAQKYAIVVVATCSAIAAWELIPGFFRRIGAWTRRYRFNANAWIRALVSLMIGAWVRALNVLGRLLRSSFVGTASALQALASTLPVAIRRYFLDVVPTGPKARAITAASAAIVLAGSFAERVDGSVTWDPSIELPPVPAVEVEWVDAELPSTPEHQELQDLHLASVPICEVMPGQLDWALGSEKVFNVRVDGCGASNGALAARGLIVLGLASGDFLESRLREDQRALSRGIVLANWLSEWVTPQTPIYVLDLGTTSGRELPSKYFGLLGSPIGNRPVGGLAITTYPRTADFNAFDVGRALDDYAYRLGMSRDFSKCALYQFYPEGGQHNQLRLVHSFECGAHRSY